MQVGTDPTFRASRLDRELEFDAARCFPKLNADRAWIHLTPGDICVVSGAVSSMGLRNPGQRPADPTRIYWVNGTGGRILAKCLGDKSASAILEDLSSRDHLRMPARGFWTFLMSAHRAGHLRFEPLPTAPGEVVLTGSLEYFVPTHASIEITNQCNLRCVHCYNDFRSKERLPWSELKDILLRWNELGLRAVEVTGGEPLVHEKFWEIFTFCAERFYRVSLLTNGTLIDEQFIERAVELGRHVQYGLSLDGSTSDRHDAIRGRGSFEKTVRAARLLAQTGLRVRVAMAIGPHNMKDIQATAALAQALGVQKFALSPVQPFGRGKEMGWAVVESAELAEQMGETLQRFPELIKTYDASLPGFGERLGNCGMVSKNLVLTPSGKLKACLVMDEREYLGDLRMQSLDEVFRSESCQAVVRVQAPNPVDCCGCAYDTYCRGCVARAVSVIEKERRLCRWAQRGWFLKAFRRYRPYRYNLGEPVFRAGNGHERRYRNR